MAHLLLANPSKRRRKTTSKKRVSRRRSPSRALASVSKTVRRYRRNPIRARSMMDIAKKGAIGAAGALAVDVAMQKLPIHENLKSGHMGAATKGAIGIAIGLAVAKFGKNKQLGQQLAEGAVTVSLYNAGKSAIGPSLGLSGDDELLGWNDDGLMYFDEDGDSDMSYYSATPVFEESDY